MIEVAPSASFETVADGFDTGLAGTIGVRVIDNIGATTIARVTAGIIEYPAGSGIYQKTLTAPSVAGQYTLVWDDGTVSPTHVGTEDLLVTSSIITLGGGDLYITRAEMKTALSMGSATYGDDDIDRACLAVSRAIDNAVRGRNSHFYQATETRYYTPDDTNYVCYRGEHRLEIDDLVSASSVTVDVGGNGSYSTTWVEGTDFYFDPANAAADSKAYEELVLRIYGGRYFPNVQRAVKITGVFGWPAVPPEVNQYAQIFAAQQVMRSRQAPFGVLMAGVEVGTSARISRFDPDFDRLLGSYVRTKLFI